MTRDAIPAEFDRVRTMARRAIAPIKPAAEGSGVEDGFPFGAKRTTAGQFLPKYYLVYFLLVEFLGFRDLGREEKVAWSVPIDFEGRGYLIEHRKLGLGVFGNASEQAEADAGRIVSLIRRGVRAAQPFFRALAEKAVAESQFNVLNNSGALFDRYEYLRGLHSGTMTEAEARKDECVEEKHVSEFGTAARYHFPAFELRRRADWLAMATIDAFFSWTEHVFIHLALLQGRISTGAEIGQLAGAEWGDKFKAALDLADRRTKQHFDDLTIIRRQLRNFIAHGAFGKAGEAFRFHSNAGAVPVALDYKGKEQRFSLSPELAFDDEAAVKVVDAFVGFLWSGPREAAKLYIQDGGLPLILTMVEDGTYKRAMASVEAMNQFVEGLTRYMDDASNMDW